ncbi:MAG: di-trans,poly-cis-decaprenylcistransferase, partial [Gammaproteobacteria bacterium]|nr:di-trans,poly-cis-decaprenylcistransferase [Gammaproteobacteria bacterium]
MDGNGRWAKKRFLPRNLGHMAGVKATKKAVAFATRHGIKALTLFAFSSENWNRPKAEVEKLMSLFVSTLREQADDLNKNGVRLRFIGNIIGFSDKLQNAIREVETLTAENTGLQLMIAANYGGRWDLADAAKKIAADVVAGKVDIDQVDAAIFAKYVALSELPEPDLFIRTGGEKRISNFLLWQIAYTELYFTDVLWPDFGDAAFVQALESFALRRRRFGKTDEQISNGQISDKQINDDQNDASQGVSDPIQNLKQGVADG